MTAEEAINNIKEIQGIITDAVPCCDPDDNWGRYTITLNKAIEALKKQTPKKPHSYNTRIFGQEKTAYDCPSCKHCFTMINPQAFEDAYSIKRNMFCDICGQAIDWSEIE